MNNSKQPLSSASNQASETDEQQSKKPPSDLLQGVVLFIAFIIFMAVWLHFNLGG